MQQRYARRCCPECTSSTITLVEAGISDNLLGNRARAGYRGDNESLRSVVCCCLPPLYLFKTRRNFLEVKFQENCQAQSQLEIWPKFLAELELETPRNKGFLELFLATSTNQSSEPIRDGLITSRNTLRILTI